MARNRDRKQGFLMRLLRSKAGNVLPITAAMLIPLLGVVGGGVDMARLYLVKSRMQQACDAGALAGRKAMGTGNWTTGGTSSSEARALALFDGNFKQNDYGASTFVPSFTEAGGTVTGTATTTVPMTVMRALGFSQKSISVNCTAKMEIPNTDVMFVLDVTGSMDDCPDGSNCNGNSSSKIAGLQVAVKCFYEALVKVNTPQVCGSDPTATTYSGLAQIRLGFVPYSVNVNVGRLLPNAYLADSWAYQSREAVISNVWTWNTTGTESAVTWGSWPSNPSSLTSASSYSGWSNISGSGSVTINGTSWPKTYAGKNSTTCPALNTMGNILDYTYVTISQQSPTSTAVGPINPASQLTRNYSQVENRRASGYRYRWSSSGSGSCRLQGSNDLNFTVTRTGTSTQPLTWTQVQQVTGWTYLPRTLTVAGLKAGGSSWNSSVSLPIGSTSMTVNLEGQTGSSSISVPADTVVTWGGCIEERHTHQVTSSGNIATDWATIPSDAYDLDIDMIPSASTANSFWGPLLPSATWSRTSGGSRTLSNTTSGSQAPNVCPTEAKKLQEWTTPSSFVSYVDSLNPTGNTYHDIGMIWGARFISPTGIFASENAATPTGAAIQRHIIFMTDGDTMTSLSNYGAHGMTWWNRLQTSFAPSTTDTDDIVNARLTALCTAIKNKNITLWVVSFGSGVSSAAQTRLNTCASSGKFFNATDSATLLNNFRQIAAEISDLRLTS